MLNRIASCVGSLVLLMPAAVAQAAIPGAGGVISACYDTKGNMRVIDAEAGEVCGNKETPISMNQAGQTGATGPTGPTGPSDAYVLDFGAFGPFLPSGDQTLATLNLPAGEYVIEALIRFRAMTVRDDPANIYCELIAEVADAGELDIFNVDFNTEEDNGYVKLAPLVGWVESSGPFVLHVDCEHFVSIGVDDIAIDESKLVAVRYGDVHVPPVPPPND